MCKYCGEVSIDTERELAIEPFTCLVAKKYADGRFSLIAYGDYDAEYFPCYCPICGSGVNSNDLIKEVN